MVCWWASQSASGLVSTFSRSFTALAGGLTDAPDTSSFGPPSAWAEIRRSGGATGRSEPSSHLTANANRSSDDVAGETAGRAAGSAWRAGAAADTTRSCGSEARPSRERTDPGFGAIARNCSLDRHVDTLHVSVPAEPGHARLVGPQLGSVRQRALGRAGARSRRNQPRATHARSRARHHRDRQLEGPARRLQRHFHLHPVGGGDGSQPIKVELRGVPLPVVVWAAALHHEAAAATPARQADRTAVELQALLASGEPQPRVVHLDRPHRPLARQEGEQLALELCARRPHARCELGVEHGRLDSAVPHVDGLQLEGPEARRAEGPVGPQMLVFGLVLPLSPVGPVGDVRPRGSGRPLVPRLLRVGHHHHLAAIVAERRGERVPHHLGVRLVLGLILPRRTPGDRPRSFRASPAQSAARSSCGGLRPARGSAARACAGTAPRPPPTRTPRASAAPIGATRAERAAAAYAMTTTTPLAPRASRHAPAGAPRPRRRRARRGRPSRRTWRKTRRSPAWTASATVRTGTSGKAPNGRWPAERKPPSRQTHTATSAPRWDARAGRRPSRRAKTIRDRARPAPPRRSPARRCGPTARPSRWRLPAGVAVATLLPGLTSWRQGRRRRWRASRPRPPDRTPASAEPRTVATRPAARPSPPPTPARARPRQCAPARRRQAARPPPPPPAGTTGRMCAQCDPSPPAAGSAPRAAAGRAPSARPSGHAPRRRQSAAHRERRVHARAERRQPRVATCTGATGSPTAGGAAVPTVLPRGPPGPSWPDSGSARRCSSVAFVFVVLYCTTEDLKQNYSGGT
eukprot:scaffold15213_cov101-Isochrysis_galbana.AAC.2